jgi:hypothetical protein
MANVRQQEQKKGKVERVPFGAQRYKLQLSDADNKEFKRRGFVTRWFNDQDGRVERALGGGYQYVKPEEAPSLGSGVIHQGNTDLGDRVSKIVSRGEPVIRAFLMKIKKKLYDEDQATKQAIVDEKDALLMAGKNADGTDVIEGQYGKGLTFSK